MRHGFAYRFVRGPDGKSVPHAAVARERAPDAAGSDSEGAALAWIHVAEAYEAKTGEPMTAPHARMIASRAMAKLRERLARQGITELDDF